MQYAWFLWSLSLLIIWMLVYFSLPAGQSRREMRTVSFWTSLLGLTEPIFVPEYWNPPSLFDLAQRTGFDVESFIFAFAVGGLAAVIYERIFKTKHAVMTKEERHRVRHSYHFMVLLATPLLFFFLIFGADFNPIYSTVIALIGGGILSFYCRPDLKKKMVISAFLFSGFYFVYFLALLTAFPDYAKEVWNPSAIYGIFILGVPIEELLFAFSLGLMWSSVYEHIKWYKIKKI